MARLNDALVERRVGSRYLTLLVLLWQPATGLLTMCTAAGAPPIILRNGEILEPKLEGFPLGLFPNRAYDDVQFQTQPGDLLVLYSDGIQDQSNHAKEDYGSARLRPLLRTVATLPAREVVEKLFIDFDAFRGNEPTHDDQTVVAIRVK